ncbi:Golgi SNAP receptor complex member 1-like protein [Sarcoptes scabiei]|uniref:Golgi SNAP receptor complex member 1 n=1 Tax=Sarcoptes scabiei TaxID=52283 RepID=A0A131ZZI0_SARSC|nr:Golgi SNAP receptor complex member 1-like protein [Sarcoptes scabiei]
MRYKNGKKGLRRTTRQIENDLDSKLFSLSKLKTDRSSSLNTHHHNNRRDHRNYSNENEDLQPLISSKNNFDYLTHEIDSLIDSLQTTNNQMNECAQRLPNNNSILYTLQRHTEILNDYRKEFTKVKATIQNQLNRDTLFESDRMKLLEKNFPTTNHQPRDFLQKESEHIEQAEIMIEDQINIAVRTREHLLTQRSAMKAIRTELTTLASKFRIETGFTLETIFLRLS